MDKYQTDVQITNIDYDIEELLKIQKEQTNKNLLDLQEKIENFLFKHISIAQTFNENLDFKNSYNIYRKIEKLLNHFLSQLLFCDCPGFPIKQILKNLENNVDDLATLDISFIQKCPLQIVIKQFPSKHFKQIKLGEILLKHLILCLNNEGVIYMLRTRSLIAINYIYKAAMCQMFHLVSFSSQYYLGCIAQNLGFCFKQLEDLERSQALLSKAIQLQEIQEERLFNPKNELQNIIEKSSKLLNLVELLYNKTETEFIDVSLFEKEKLLYLLSMSYQFFSEVFSMNSEKKQKIQFCKSQSELLYNKFQKIKNSRFKMNQDNNSLVSKTLKQDFPSFTAKKIKMLSDSQFSNSEENLINSRISLVFQGTSLAAKENIIFSKYMTIKENRFKVYVLQYKEFNCLEIIYYNKPLNYFRKLAIGLQSIYIFAKKSGFKIEDKQSLEKVFEDLISQTEFINAEPALRGVATFESIEKYLEESENPFRKLGKKNVSISEQEGLDKKKQQLSEKIEEISLSPEPKNTKQNIKNQNSKSKYEGGTGYSSILKKESPQIKKQISFK